MPINDHIERWALNQGADRLALAVINGQITLDDLGEIARRKPVFASKFALVQQQLETMPNPKEKEEYDVIVAQYGVDNSSEEIFNKMSVYVSRWNGNTAAADRVSEVKGWMSIIKEMNDYQRLAARVPADPSAYEASGKVPSVEVEQALKMYLAQWNGGGIASDEHLNKVEDWSRRVVTIRKQKVENDWNAIFDADGKLISIDLLKEFAQLYSSATDYSSRIDDLYWEWAMSQSDVLSAAADYNGYYNGMGKHSPRGGWFAIFVPGMAGDRQYRYFRSYKIYRGSSRHTL